MKQEQSRTVQLGDVLTPEDFEREYQIKQGTQAAMRSRGQLPFLRLGGGRIIRYRRAQIEQWLETRTVGVRNPGTGEGR